MSWGSFQGKCRSNNSVVDIPLHGDCDIFALQQLGRQFCIQSSNRPMGPMGYQQVKARLGRLGFIYLLLSAAGAPQTTPEAAIRLLAAQDAAVLTVGERLSVAARDLCAPGGWATGVLVQTRTQYGLGYRDVAIRLLALGDHPTITFVVPGSAAHRAGLLPGDQIVAVDDQTLPRRASSQVPPRMADTERALDVLEAGVSDGEARLQILRSGLVFY